MRGIFRHVRSRARLGLAVLAVVATALLVATSRGPAPMLKVATAEELAALYAAHGYAGPEAGGAVPRILLASLPGDLDAVDPADRKTLFLKLMLPLVLAANEEIAADRAQLQVLADRLAAGESLGGEPADWLAAVARRYRLPLDHARDDSAAFAAAAREVLPELLRRVDEVPPSLALAQAALESGWGTSRLALQGNALFGERTWTEAGLQPLDPAPGATHRARRFDSLMGAVAAYMHNLNTHPAYAGFRQARAALRDRAAPLDGAALVRHLTAYSELGPAYTRAVAELIRDNGLTGLDGAALADRRA